MELDVGAPQTEIGEYTLGSYWLHVGRTLGKGTFGKVKLGKHRRTGQLVAIKILEKDKIVETTDVERVARQIHILKLVRHPSIVQLYELIETPKYLMLVMEYARQGQLFTRIVRNKRLEEQQSCRLFGQLVDAIDYCHRLKVAHRDIKPQNLLIDFDGRLKLSDFGLSNTYSSGELLKTFCGSLSYAAPEMLRQQLYNGLKADIWSSGVVLFAMLEGQLPFEDDNHQELTRKIKSAEYQINATLSDQAVDLLRRVLNVDPQERYDIEQIRRHPWMRKHAQCNSLGLLVGFNTIPVEERVMTQLQQLGYDTQQVRTSVQANLHNNITAAYYLLLKKFVKEGGQSNCELSSNSFDPSLIRPPPRTEREDPAKLLALKLMLQPASTTHRNCSQHLDLDKSKENVQNNGIGYHRPQKSKERVSFRPSHKPIKIQESSRFQSKDLITPANRMVKKLERNSSMVKSQSRNRSRSVKTKQRGRVTSTMETSNITRSPCMRQPRNMNEWAGDCSISNTSNFTFAPNCKSRPLEVVLEKPCTSEVLPKPRRRSRKSSIGKQVGKDDPINLKRNVERYLMAHRG